MNNNSVCCRNSASIFSAQISSAPQFGQVHGTIVMETFPRLMFAENSSLLTLPPDWQPAGNPNFALKNFVRFALDL